MDTFLWYVELAWDYVQQMLPCALAAGIVFFCVLPLRRRRLAARGLSSPVLREAGLLLFVLFAAGLAGLTVFPANFWPSLPVLLRSGPNWQTLRPGAGFYWNITLLDELLDGDAWRMFLMLGNLAMFAPFGFFSALLWRRPRWWKSVLAAFGASVLVEVVQLFVGRSSDINDIILNTLGGAAGYAVFLLLRRLAPRFAARFQCTRMEVPNGRETGDRTAAP